MRLVIFAVLSCSWSVVSPGCGVTVRMEPLPDAGGEGEGEGCQRDEDCPPDARCENGACITTDPCANVPCPEGKVCSEGECVDEWLDADGDGFPAGSDCDDHDRFVVPGSVRSCRTGCGEGTTTCAEGRWQPCTSPETCDCEIGSKREEPCGNCGSARRECGADGRWGDLGECADQGSCNPGAAQVEPCEDGGCGQHARTCSESCEWGPFGACEDPSECTPGEQLTQPCGNCGSRGQTCNVQCLWPGFGDCTGEGECGEGDGEDQACGNCGTETRICERGCTWGQWSECGEGACQPGEVDSRPCGNCLSGTQSRTCGADCNWGDWGHCDGEGCDPLTVERQPCDPCGERRRVCSNECEWSNWSMCPVVDCDPEEDDPYQEACGNCGTQTVSCSASCQWIQGACENEGVCTPGQQGFGNQCGDCGIATMLCLDDCTWDPNATCTCDDTASEDCEGGCGTMLCGGMDAECGWGDCLDSGGREVPCHCTDQLIGDGCIGDMVSMAPGGLEPCQCGVTYVCEEQDGSCDWEIFACVACQQ